MNYRIEEKGKLKIVGEKKWVSTINGQQMKEIPKMWNELPKGKMDLIKSLNDKKEIIGLCADMYNDGFDYWIGSITNKECPEELYEIEIPASTWAIFEVVGPIRPLPNKMQDIWGRIFSEWFPSSGYKHAEVPEIEYYSNEDMMSENYKSEIWIPVIKL